jgi:hypothetical protein
MTVEERRRKDRIANMYQCCKGVDPCEGSHFVADRRRVSWHQVPLIECHHPEIVCQFQHTWYGTTKYCECKKHSEMK